MQAVQSIYPEFMGPEGVLSLSLAIVFIFLVASKSFGWIKMEGKKGLILACEYFQCL